MKNLRLLIWNDSATIADSWKAYALRDGFTDVEASSATDHTEIVSAYSRMRPDIVVLDLVDDKTDKPVGLTIGKSLHSLDPLAPIIVLTRKPEDAYETDGYLRWQGFAGIYPRDVVVPRDQFRDIVIAESLVVKHLLQPEYCLARECALSIEIGWQSKPHSIAILREAIYRLPSCGSTDAWHPLLCHAILAALRERGWHGIAERYAEACTTFQKSDPFYMAGSTSRRHLSHNVQVCLLGLAILLADSPVRQVVSEQKLDLVDAVLVWCCIGTVHDAAYLSEHLTSVVANLVSLAKRFAPYVQGQPLSPWTWPTDHHAAVAAKMWAADGLKGDEKQACEMISDGIAKHDAKFRKGPPVSCDRWYEFLAILCDELQDWQRERPGAIPGVTNAKDEFGEQAPWRLIEPMRIGVTRDNTGHHTLTLEFMFVDHARLIQDNGGSPNTNSVGKRFDRILQTIEEHLVCPQRMGIELAAHFLTRRAEPVLRRGNLRRA